MGSGNAMQKSAAEIVKGEQRVMIISEAEVMRLLDLNRLLDGLADGFRALSRGDIQTPHRPEITVPEKGFMLSMPSWRKGDPMMVKMVCVFEDNLKIDLPNHLALINLFDEQTGMPLCVMDGTYITGIRTAAAAVLSARKLARPDARIATIIGAGVQGREHLRLLPLIRDFDEIQVCSLYHDDAEKLAALTPKARAVVDVEGAVRRSDVVCLCSHSGTPVIAADWVKPGTHVTSVGYTPWPGELPQELVRNHTLFVEDDASFEPQPVGCAELQGVDPATATKLGDMLCGKAPGRTGHDQITVYKAMGVAMEDLVAATLVYRRAKEEGFRTAAVL
jgi:ornithine cyclodeaminase/alanine dehydrogenase-like protein (mu-crystallin family)